MIAVSLVMMVCPAPSLSREGTNRPTVSGRVLELAIEDVLLAKGFKIVPHAKWKESELYRQPQAKFAVRDVPYKSIFGHRATIELLLIVGDRQILIEAKRQKHSGSTDEKLPYVFHNAVLNLPEREFILVMDGDGFKPGAVAWIRGKANETNGFSVVTLNEFIDWVRAEF